MILRDLHVHTRFCDGTATVKEMILAALDLGMQTIGFSGHGYTAFDESYCIPREKMVEYRDEVYALRDQYKGKIEVLCGIEQDYYGEKSALPFDYVIGSMHYVQWQDQYLSVDESAEVFAENVKTYFHGDYYAFVKEYYQQMETLLEVTKADIIGHFDLVTKFNDENRFFDTENIQYKEAAFSALRSLIKAGKPFEVNTGGMARGYMQTPYPKEDLLREIAKSGGKVILSSDSHSPDTLLYNFSETEKYLKDLHISII